MSSGNFLTATTKCQEEESDDSSGFKKKKSPKDVICTSEPQKNKKTEDGLQVKHSFLLLRSAFPHLKMIRTSCNKWLACLF